MRDCVQFALPFCGWCSPSHVAGELNAKHYLGAAARGQAWRDSLGIMVFSAPTSRMLPTSWLELTRWCLYGEHNGGSRQWSRVVSELLRRFPMATTVVSYSDPSAGHTGALYRASGWYWAPTWHRLRPPPTGNGQWTTGRTESTKDRWVFLLAQDDTRQELLRIRDESIVRRMPWASFTEPRWRNGRPVQDKAMMAAWKRWTAETLERSAA